MTRGRVRDGPWCRRVPAVPRCIWLERGGATGISESIIDEVTHAFQFDEVERARSVQLIRTTGTP